MVFIQQQAKKPIGKISAIYKTIPNLERLTQLKMLRYNKDGLQLLVDD